MVNRFTISLAIAFIALLSSCGSETKDVNTTATVADDTTVVKNIKPSGSGYAKVNGLEMYYEVYGEGKPLVLIHGSFMNIISNWSAIIPSLAKDRKVIVAEM